MRYLITDEIWAAFGPMVERCTSPLGPEPELPERLFFEAVLYWARTGVPWRDLPGEFGKGVVLKDTGAEVTVMTAGPILSNVLEACRDLPVLVVHGAWNTRAPLPDARSDIQKRHVGGNRG